MSQKTCDFSSKLTRKVLCCKSADIDFVLVFPIQNGSRTLFFKSLVACIFDPKNLPKTLPKPRPNPLKIDVENVLFFNIDFFGFRPRFWNLLGLQDGAKSAALLAAPGVLDPTACYACNCMLRGGQGLQNPGGAALMLGPCWHTYCPRTSFFRT